MKKILGVIVVLAIAAVVALLMPAERKENGMQRLNRTDPEFVAIWNNLQQSEAILHNSLGEKERLLLILASNIATQSAGMYQETLAKALEKGISPVEIKEVLYHAVPYAGGAKVYGFLLLTNELFAERGIKLPTEAQGTVSQQTRFDKGLAVQKFSASRLTECAPGRRQGRNIFRTFCRPTVLAIIIQEKAWISSSGNC